MPPKYKENKRFFFRWYEQEQHEGRNDCCTALSYTENTQF